MAPNFSAKDHDGNVYSLESYRGSKVILYFYPKDDTPGCTKEACNLRDNHEALQNAGYKVIGVSVDDASSHKKFSAKLQLPFPLLSDEDKSIVQAYGVWGEKIVFGKKCMTTARTTYVIDENGAISKVISKVKPEEHASQILA